MVISTITTLQSLYLHSCQLPLTQGRLVYLIIDCVFEEIMSGVGYKSKTEIYYIC